MDSFSRRKFLRTGAGVIAFASASTVFGNRAFAQTAQVRHFWWGNPERDKRTFAVIDIFNEAHPDITVTGETLGFNDYFTKLTTQIAGGSTADVFTLGHGSLLEYVDRGVAVPLDEYVGGALDVSGLDDSQLQAGSLNGKLYGISMGANAHAGMYNARVYEEAGLKAGEDFDPLTWTFDDLERVGKIIVEKTGVAGTEDATASWQYFFNFVLQHGVTMYNDDGSFGPSPELVAEYFETWKRLREAGVTPDAQVTAGLIGSDLSQSGIVTGRAATQFSWSNQILSVQNLTQDPVAPAMYATYQEGKSGTFIQPGLYMCLSRDSSNPEAAATYMSAIVNDPEITGILGVERGVPASAAVREALVPDLTPEQAVAVNYIGDIQDKVVSTPPSPPAGNTEIEQIFPRLAVAVLLEQGSIGDIARDFVNQAQSTLARA